VFTRVLAYAPDPLLYVDPELLRADPPAEPPLRLDPELVRAISPGQPRDDDGLEAMVPLVAADDDPTRFLLPLQDGVTADDPRLFGLWTYELRFGHVAPWSTAHGRFSRPLRVTGIQHPAPSAPCAAWWAAQDLVVSATYATPVLDGHQVGDGVPRTVLGFLLYAQVRQADGTGYRNVLLGHHVAEPVAQAQRAAFGTATFNQQEISAALRGMGLPANPPLSALAVEFYSAGGSVGSQYPHGRQGGPAPQGPPGDPFDPRAFGRQRILRASPLAAVQPIC
jgi:hypothetical protein